MALAATNTCSVSGVPQRGTRRWRVAAAKVCGLLLATAPAAAQTAAQIEKHGDWTLYGADDGGGRLCFISTQPFDTKPDTATRQAIHFYISAWPKDGVKTEVSVRFATPLRKASEPTVTIGPTAFKMFVKDDKAFIADATAELKLIDAMKKGSKMLVEAVSARGTANSDLYSLAGFTQALQALTTKCK